MINTVNQNVLVHLGVRCPETPLEAYENVKWNLIKLNRLSQAVMSSGMGILGMVLEKMDCFTEHQSRTPSSTVTTTLTIPNLDVTEGTTTDTVLSTVTSLTTITETHTTGASTTSSLLSTVLSMINGNETNATEASATSPLLSTMISMITGNQINENSSSTMALITAAVNGVLQPHTAPLSQKKDYCLPMSGIAVMMGGVIFVWAVVDMVKRCRGGRNGRQSDPLPVAEDILWMGASGFGVIGNVLLPACYPGTPNPQVCGRLAPMVLVSSILYFTHAGVLVLSAICSDRRIETTTPESEEDKGVFLDEIPFPSDVCEDAV
ncbi:hypothetical protein CLAVI_000263 [Candidatus Clavichlamydia salmonicola]|uniref:hypothetical protein n=1 Tax=Candidatus Clavichlamydia salmonicola TaxID=469812 RepID=UPI001891866A|nr:hypothetical protein [Candidatus Clavichlamydia salmonicola]MBF5050649.1 hypothetical protein [Candidatus Clavichlamydia salmonicola]